MAGKPKRMLEGNVVKLPLSGGNHGYGRLLQHPLMEFYSLASSEQIDCREITASPVAFRIWVMDSAVKSGRWEVVGNVPLQAEHNDSPWFFKQDRHSKKLSLYRHGAERPATFEMCEGLECADIWSAEHVESRLDDHIMGRTNKWVEALRLRR